jgi:hypothetical protein
MRSKKIGILIAFVLAGFLGSSGTAVAVSDEPAALAAGCRAAPYSATFNLYFETESHNDLGTYQTTSQCNDINARSTNGTGYYACVIFVRHTSECNYRTFLPAGGQWVNIATDVLDNTLFNVRVFKGGANNVFHAGVMDF